MTSTIELPYGKGRLCFDLPGGWQAEVFRPNPILPAKEPLEEIIRCLENPLGGKRLEDFRGAKSATIAVSDETRFIPYGLILPPLLEGLKKMGIGQSAIRLVVASGLHPPMAESSFSNILPSKIVREYSVSAHDATRSDLKFLGNTSRGTPVFVNSLFHQADLRLIVGLIDPHQFVGYTGGVKGAAIGLAGKETIEANHSMLFDHRANIGEVERNPVRQEIEEIGKRMGVHFVVNVVLNESNEVVRVFAGDPLEVERIGSEFCRTIYELNVSKEYDVVIASPGGYPKDLNVYQAQKALAHVTPLVRKGGDILFFAECPDGHGDEVFCRTMTKNKSPREVIENFKKEKFRMGDHKAFLWCRSLARAQVHLYSSIDEELSLTLMVRPIRRIEDVLEEIRMRYPTPPSIAVMPKASSTYFRIQR